MRGSRFLYALACFAFACGGTDGNNLGDGGSDSAQQGDSNNPSDGGADSNVMCNGGQVACGGKCVDTATDPMNCGGCGSVCNTQCVAGVCQLISMGCDAGNIQPVGDNACIALDSTSVYWSSGNQNGSIYKIPTAGGCPSVVVTGQSAPHAVASDGKNVYFANQGSNPTSGTVNSVPVGGGNVTPIAMNQTFPLDIVVDNTNVYWTNSGDGSVWKSDKTTPNPMKLAGPAGQGRASHLRVDSMYVYFTDRAGGVVNRVPIGGGNVTALTGTTPGPNYLAIDSANAYFGGGAQNQMAAAYSVPLNAMAAMPTSLVGNLARINGIDTDGTSIYFAISSTTPQYMNGNGEIHRATIKGQGDTVLAKSQNGPQCIVLDSTSVYWINSFGGMISKTGK